MCYCAGDPLLPASLPETFAVCPNSRKLSRLARRIQLLLTIAAAFSLDRAWAAAAFDDLLCCLALRQMWVFEETVNGRKLTDIINTENENVKYLPKAKFTPNLVAGQYVLV